MKHETRLHLVELENGRFANDPEEAIHFLMCERPDIYELTQAAEWNDDLKLDLDNANTEISTLEEENSDLKEEIEDLEKEVEQLKKDSAA